MQTSDRSTRARRDASGRDLLRELPAVSRILATGAFRALCRRWGSELITDLLRDRLEGLRREIVAESLDRRALRQRVSAAELARAVGHDVRELVRPSPRPVINATGIVVHTNLGRAVLSVDAASRLAETASSYVDLEYDLEQGRRGKRLSHLAPLIGRLLPGHDFTVVNNNAAAILLCLRVLARGREVLVSRGELVEIGGSFRVPDIMAASGARLREVGTTNRTRVGDYEAAIGPRTGLLLKVHTSNFRIVGFTEEPTLAELVGLARRSGLPLVVDWGSGDLVDLGPFGIHDEMPVARILDAGADLVTFSGDKLLGGPQAGFIVGRPELIARIRRDPLSRVCRLDRLLLGALHATLVAYVTGRESVDVPTLRMLALDEGTIRRRAERVRRRLARGVRGSHRVDVVPGISRTGGGSSPMGERPTCLVRVAAAGGDAARIERCLRGGDPPVIARIHEGCLLVDLRTVPEEQEELLVERLADAILADEA